jgi:hypothetical protein
MMDPVVVSHRVDALTLAYRVLLFDKVTREFRARGAIAREHGRAAYTDTAGADWELKVPRRGDGQIWRLRREEHVRLQIDPKAPGGKRELVDVLEPVPLDYENAGSARVSGVVGKVGWQNTGDLGVVEEPGWTIELVFYASHLADVPLDLVVREGREIARRFGVLHEERMRRIDFAADVAGFDIRERDYANFIRRSRVKVFPFTKKPKDDDGFRELGAVTEKTRDRVANDAAREEAAYCDPVASAKIAGIRVGRTDVVARIYDKREELEAKGSPDKRAHEEERWTKGGWDGDAPVTRVEFQLRGEALTEVGARDPECCGIHPKSGEFLVDTPCALHKYAPRLWATCLKWLWLGKPRPASRSRWDVDERWKPLYAVEWTSDETPSDHLPIKRVRVRGGASAAQSLGSLVSFVAASGKDVGRVTGGKTEAWPEKIEDYASDAVGKLRTMLAILTRVGAEEIERAMIDRWASEEAAAQHVAIVLNAARARFPIFVPKGQGPPLKKFPPGQISFWEWAQSKEEERKRDTTWQAN